MRTFSGCESGVIVHTELRNISPRKVQQANGKTKVNSLKIFIKFKSHSSTKLANCYGRKARLPTIRDKFAHFCHRLANL